MASHVLLTSAAVWLGGCVDLTPVEPPLYRQAVLHLSLRIGDGVAAGSELPAAVRVSATLDPGVDDTGRQRRMADETLRVLGESHAPVQRSRGGQRTYSFEVFLPQDRLIGEPITLEPPRLEGVETGPLEVRWPVYWRVGARAIEIEEGFDLVLGLGGTGADAWPPPSFLRWSVSVFQPDGWFSQGADAAPPAEVRIPGEMLGEVGEVGEEGEPLSATVYATQSGAVGGAAGEYEVRLELSQEARWEGRRVKSQE